VVAKQGRLV